MLMDMEMDHLKPLFGNGLQDSHVGVQLAALKAFSSTLIDSDRATRIQLSPLLQVAFEILPPLANNGDNDNLRSALLTFTQLASSHPALFESHVNSVLNFAGEVASQDERPFEVRQPALELLLSLAEGISASCRRHSKFSETFIRLCLKWMSIRSSDVEDWETTDDIDETIDEEEPAQVGEEYIDRLSNALGMN